jgi:hypothetical protein
MNRESVEAIKLVLATLNTAAQTLRQALEQPELTPEQLSFRAGYEQGRFDAQVERNFCPRCGKRLGTNDWDVHTCTPPQKREWVGLTDEEMRTLKQKSVDDGMTRIVSDFEYIRSIEAKLKEKNT